VTVSTLFADFCVLIGFSREGQLTPALSPGFFRRITFFDCLISLNGHYVRFNCNILDVLLPASIFIAKAASARYSFQYR